MVFYFQYAMPKLTELIIHWINFIVIFHSFLHSSVQGGKVHEVIPMWSTNPPVREQHKEQPQHRELHALYISSKGHFRKFSLSCHTFLLISQFGKYHNTLCLSPQILHEHCFQFLLGLIMVPRENKNNAYAKFGGTKKEYYGIFRTGLFNRVFNHAFV